MEKIENLLVMAKKAVEDIDKDWLSHAKEQAIEARQRKFEKLDSFPTNDIGGSEEDPAVFLVEALDEPREVEIRNRVDKDGKPQKNKVMDITIHKSSDSTVEEGKSYSLWFSTVLTKEIEALPKPLKDSKFILCYYGRYQKGKKPATTDPHIWRCIPSE